MSELALAALVIAVPSAVLAGRLVPKRTPAGTWTGRWRHRAERPKAAVPETLGTRLRAVVRERSQESPVTLADLPPGILARVESLGTGPEASEDLPLWLTPGQQIAVTDADARTIDVRGEKRECRLPRTAAERILTSPVEGTVRRLSALKVGESGEIQCLSPDCAGLARRRLLDMGLTPGTPVTVALENTFGDPRGFKVRSTTVALRRRQTDQVWVRSSSRRDEGKVPA